MRHLLRTYREFDLDDVEKHLVIMGDLKGDCAACRALGINLDQQRNCPECGTEFKYVSSRRTESHPGERFQIVRRTCQRRPDLIFIDYTDYQKVLGQKKARDFFSS